MTPRLAAFALALATLAGCDSAASDAQLTFEAVAFSGTSDGVTPDDWRVGPIFGAGASVTVPASPNPATPGERVTLQLYGDEGLGTFSLYRRELDGDLLRIQLQSGPAYTFTFFASDASPTGTSGSSRLIVYDGFQRVVTYGDLVLR